MTTSPPLTGEINSIAGSLDGTAEPTAGFSTTSNGKKKRTVPMKLNNPIDFQNLEGLSRALRAGKVSRERFSIEIPEADACNGLYAVMKEEIARRGGKIILDEGTRSHIIQAARWLINPTAPPCLLLCGLYGNGKTTLARAIARFIEFVTERELGYTKRRTMKFYTAKDVCRICAASEKFKEQYDEYHRLFNEPMMILDELGEEPKSVLVYGMLHSPIVDLISERYAKQHLTVFTTNLESHQLKDKYGERITDRFREMVTSIIFENDSYRTNPIGSQMDYKR